MTAIDVKAYDAANPRLRIIDALGLSSVRNITNVVMTLEPREMPKVVVTCHLHNNEVDTFHSRMSLQLHPITRDLVDRFAAVLAQKLSMAEKKYGYSDGWAQPGHADEFREELRRHVDKGDPLDVAAYCAFLWHHGDSTAKQPQGTPEDPATDLGRRWSETT